MRKNNNALNDRSYKWDVVAAEKDYIEDVTMSMPKIAEKYGVTERTVQRYAAKAEWTKKRGEAVIDGLDKHKSEHSKLIAETNERHLKYWKSAQAAAYNSLFRAEKQQNTREINTSINALRTSVEGERTVLGMPTFIRADAAEDNEALKPTNIIDAARKAREIIEKEQGGAGGDSKA